MKASGLTHYYISAGSNVSEARRNVERAIDMLQAMLDDAVSSSVYFTPSVCLGDDSIYCNAVIGGWSNLSPDELTARLKEIEIMFGRTHDKKTRSVELDLDVVIAGEDVLRPRDYDRQYFRIGFNQLIKP